MRALGFGDCMRSKSCSKLTRSVVVGIALEHIGGLWKTHRFTLGIEKSLLLLLEAPSFGATPFFEGGQEGSRSGPPNFCGVCGFAHFYLFMLYRVSSS